MLSKILPSLLLLASLVQCTQVNLDTVGPSTPLSAKSKICNVLDYGAVADNKTDIGPAISSAFTSCVVGSKATLYIPPGSFSMSTGVILNKGSGFAIQIDGLITLTATGSFGGNAIVVENADDVEVLSSNGLGAINGQGYISWITQSGQNARLFRFISCTNVGIHDIILVDSPTFHLVFNNVANLEAYHITIRGPSRGGTDGIDLICDDNCYLHHIEVTNRDECVSVKSPSTNVLIEDMFCNQSGGMSIGSLTADGTDPAEVQNITMRNINVYQCTQMLMIKTYPGGDGAFGFVKNSVFENFNAYDTTYGLDIDQYWYNHNTPNTGAVALSSLTFRNWTGTVDNGVSRAPIVIRGSDQVPLVDITLEDFSMWTVNGNKLLNQCKNVYGTGYCAAKSTAGVALTTFTTTMTTTATPAGYTSPTKPAWGVAGYDTTLPIPVYTPTVMWSVASAKAAVVVQTTSSPPTSTSKASSSSKTLALSSSQKASSRQSTKISSSAVIPKSTTKVEATATSSSIETSSISPSAATSTSTKQKCTGTRPSTSSAATTSAAAGTLGKWYQCGGIGWTGKGSCVAGTTCVVSNPYYSQCL